MPKKLATFTVKETLKITRVNQDQLFYWTVRGVIKPLISGIGRGSKDTRYDFNNLVEILVAMQVHSLGLPTNHLRKIIEDIDKLMNTSREISTYAYPEEKAPSVLLLVDFGQIADKLNERLHS